MAELTRKTANIFETEDAIVRLHFLEEHGAFFGAENIEIGHRNFFLVQEFESVFEDALLLGVPAKNKVQRVADSAPTQVAEHLAVAIHFVEILVHALERVAVDAFQTHVDVQQAAALSQVHIFVVVAEK